MSPNTSSPLIMVHVRQPSATSKHFHSQWNKRHERAHQISFLDTHSRIVWKKCLEVLIKRAVIGSLKWSETMDKRGAGRDGRPLTPSPPQTIWTSFSLVGRPTWQLNKVYKRGSWRKGPVNGSLGCWCLQKNVRSTSIAVQTVSLSTNSSQK